jgi:SAM-dependent methyltransferase
VTERLAESFDRAAADYERGRPGWPPEVAEVAGLDPSSTVLDLAAGTGKLTRVLVRRFARVIAVEPLDAMRALIEDAEALAGSAEAIPLPDDSVDGVFVAEAFHWFDGEAALREIARVLRPGGALVLMWNRQAGPMEPRFPDRLREEINRRYDETAHPMHGYRSGAWREPFVTELERFEFDNPQRLDRDTLLSFIASMSWISTLPGDEREAVLRLARAELDADEYVRPWRAEVYVTRLR